MIPVPFGDVGPQCLGCNWLLGGVALVMSLGVPCAWTQGLQIQKLGNTGVGDIIVTPSQVYARLLGTHAFAREIYLYGLWLVVLTHLTRHSWLAESFRTNVLRKHTAGPDRTQEPATQRPFHGLVLLVLYYSQCVHCPVVSQVLVQLIKYLPSHRQPILDMTAPLGFNGLLIYTALRPHVDMLLMTDLTLPTL